MSSQLAHKGCMAVEVLAPPFPGRSKANGERLRNRLEAPCFSRLSCAWNADSERVGSLRPL